MFTAFGVRIITSIVCARIFTSATTTTISSLRDDPNNPPEGTNSTAQARTPQARLSGSAREKNVHCRFFAQGRLISGSRRRHRTQLRTELLRLRKAHPSRDGLPAMPRQLLHNRFTQAIFLQRLPPLATDPPKEMLPPRRTRPSSQSTQHVAANPHWYQTPRMRRSRLSKPCPLCKEMQWPLRPPGKLNTPRPSYFKDSLNWPNTNV